VVEKGKKKGEFKALRGKIDRFEGGDIWMTFPAYKDTFMYKRIDVFNSKAEADADILNYI
jgi:hypothetical protein